MPLTPGQSARICLPRRRFRGRHSGNSITNSEEEADHISNGADSEPGPYAPGWRNDALRSPQAANAKTGIIKKEHKRNVNSSKIGAPYPQPKLFRGGGDGRFDLKKLFVSLIFQELIRISAPFDVGIVPD
jgi:hypothetical protein